MKLEDFDSIYTFQTSNTDKGLSINYMPLFWSKKKVPPTHTLPPPLVDIRGHFSWFRKTICTCTILYFMNTIKIFLLKKQKKYGSDIKLNKMRSRNKCKFTWTKFCKFDESMSWGAFWIKSPWGLPNPGKNNIFYQNCLFLQLPFYFTVKNYQCFSTCVVIFGLIC